MSGQDYELNTMLCKRRGCCTRAYFNECPFGGPLESPTVIERNDPKSVCCHFEEEADK